MIPTSIDGTDITGATIDGQDVQEITVDGQTVFTAGPNLPVAYSNLVAWYPFDSATYGGSNADDVTAIIGGSSDDTAYDGTVNGPNYQSSGGVTDINAGANSGGYDFSSQNDEISIDWIEVKLSKPFSISLWANYNSFSGGGRIFDTMGTVQIGNISGGGGFQFRVFDGVGNPLTFSTPQTNVWNLYTLVGSGTQYEGFVNAISVGTMSAGDPTLITERDSSIGGRPINSDFDGQIDDFRFYDTDLSAAQINQIYQNTQP